MADGVWIETDDKSIDSMTTLVGDLAVTVIIISYHSHNDLLRCLSALGASNYNNFRVVIVENGGAEAHAQTAALVPVVLGGGQAVKTICAPGNLGYAGGINLGVSAAPGGDAYWILNPDTAPDPGALSAMVARLQRGDVDAVGCTLIDPEGRVAARAGGRWTRAGARVIAIGMGEDKASDGDVAAIEAALGYISGASILVSARWIATVGAMREDYFLYCEEIEWCLRASAAGIAMGYAPRALVFHEAGTTTGSGNSQATMSRLSAYLNARNRVLLAGDQPGGASPGSRWLIAAHLLVRFGKRRAWSVMRHALAGWTAGMCGERGIPQWMGRAE
ncbi:MAG: glycosyltransferase family 2 protein [Sphingopyxis sp.]|nr:glycosyltransferase family 2 protein [Sphingopyxis sp.]